MFKHSSDSNFKIYVLYCIEAIQFLNMSEGWQAIHPSFDPDHAVVTSKLMICRGTSPSTAVCERPWPSNLIPDFCRIPIFQERKMWHKWNNALCEIIKIICIKAEFPFTPSLNSLHCTPSLSRVKWDSASLPISLEYNDQSGNAIQDLKYWTNIRFIFAQSSVGCKVERPKIQEAIPPFVGDAEASGAAPEVQHQPECPPQLIWYSRGLGEPEVSPGTAMVLTWRLSD